MRSRVKRVFSHVADGVDLIVFANSSDRHLNASFLYVTGLTEGIFVSCWAFCYPDGRVEVLRPDLIEIPEGESGLPLHTFPTRDERKNLLRKLLRGHRKIGVDFAETTHETVDTIQQFVPRAKFVDVGPAVARARLVKDEREIGYIRTAAKIASDALVDTLPAVRPGRTEGEVAADLVYAMQRCGASGSAYPWIILASGPNSAEPLHMAGSRRIRKGDLVVIDFGARFNHYCSDITRTVVIGKATEKQRDIYETVQRAQAASLKRMRPGFRGKSVDAAAREVIDSSAYKGRFIHLLGHSVGLEIHDGGFLDRTSNLVLRKNMVFTSEPGIYLPGFGGARIEDDVLVTAKGPEVLTTAPRELLEL